MPRCLGPQQLLQKELCRPTGALSTERPPGLPSWKAERLARRCRYSPVAGSGGHRSACGSGLRRQAGCPTAGQAVQTPWPRSPSQDWGRRAEAQLPRRSRRSPEREACAAVQPLGGRRAGDPGVHLAPGSLLALHFFFSSLRQFGGFFILKCNFLPSLLFPTRIQTATVEKGIYVFAPDWAGGAPGRRRGQSPTQVRAFRDRRWTLVASSLARQPWPLSLDPEFFTLRNQQKIPVALTFRGAVEGWNLPAVLFFFFFFWLRKNRNGRAAQPGFPQPPGRRGWLRVTPVTLPGVGDPRESGIPERRGALGPAGRSAWLPGGLGGRVFSWKCSLFILP